MHAEPPRFTLTHTAPAAQQTSCFFQALSANSTLADSVCYNGPRAGVNFNDGFGGNSLMTGNLVFNQVRETGDHG